MRRGRTGQGRSDQGPDPAEEEDVPEDHHQLLLPELLGGRHCDEDVHAPVEAAEGGRESEQRHRGVDEQVPDHDHGAEEHDEPVGKHGVHLLSEEDERWRKYRKWMCFTVF